MYLKTYMSKKQKDFLFYLKYRKAVQWHHVAKDIGVTSTHLNNVIKGKTYFRAELALELADYFEVTLNEIWTGGCLTIIQ